MDLPWLSGTHGREKDAVRALLMAKSISSPGGDALPRVRCGCCCTPVMLKPCWKTDWFAQRSEQLWDLARTPEGPATAESKPLPPTVALTPLWAKFCIHVTQEGLWRRGLGQTELQR